MVSSKLSALLAIISVIGLSSDISAMAFLDAEMSPERIEPAVTDLEPFYQQYDSNGLESRSTDIEPFNAPFDTTSLDKRDFDYFDGITGAAAALSISLFGGGAGCVLAGAGGPIGIALCIGAAIAIAISAGTLGQKLGSRGGGHSLTIDGETHQGVLNFRDHIGRHGLAGGYIGSSNKEEAAWDAQHNAEYLRVFNSTVEHWGWITANDSIHGRLVPEGFQAWPIYEFHDGSGQRVHHVELYDNSGHYKSGRLWWPDSGEPDSGKPDSGEFDKDGSKGKSVPYKHKAHFKYGGLDSKVHEFRDEDHTNRKDYAHFKKIVQCYAGKKFLKKFAGLWAQTYDARLKGTISCTAVAIVDRHGKSAIGHLKKCPTPVKTSHKCGKKYKSSG